MNFKQIEKYELTGPDIKNILGNDIKIIAYPDLRKYKDINDIFDSKGRCVLFLVESKNGNDESGHWQCIFRNQNTITFFDSYGLAPNEWNKYISKSIQKALNELAGTMLMPLLKKASNNGYTILYNHIKLQKMANNVNTCGDFVSTRLIKKELSNEQFINFLDGLKADYNVQTFDEVVSKYIYNIIGK
jgi:hypothetical protein